MYIHLGIHMGNIVFARSRFQLLFMNFTCLKNYCTPTHANCGLAEEWYDMSTTAPWRSDTPDECPTPFKDLGSPFFILPGLTSPTKICIDAAHTWHIGLPGCTGFMKFRILIDVDWIVFWKPKDWKRFHCIGSRSLVQTETLPGEVLECSIASCLQELHEMVFSEQEEHKHSCLLQKSVQDEIDSFMHLENVVWATWSMGFLLLLWATLSGTIPFLQQLEARGQTPPYCLHGWRMKWGPWWLVFKKCNSTTVLIPTKPSICLGVS